MSDDETTPMERDAQRLRGAVERAVGETEGDFEVVENANISTKHFNGEAAFVTIEARAER